MIEAIVGGIFKGGVGSLTGKIVEKIYPSVVDYFRAGSLKGYLDLAKEQIRAMPFIYRDMELNALEDYVNVELIAIDKRTQSPPVLPKKESPSDLSVIIKNKVIVLVGEAGIGKTTLFRHLALNVIEASSEHEIFHKEKLIPIYVPLKAIDANSASPILRYITTKNPYFSGPAGLRRLEKIASKGRVILLLDGYDEIPHVSGTQIIIDELQSLFTVAFTSYEQGVNKKYVKAYAAFRKGRILLSTRKEFYAAHTFKTSAEAKFFANEGVASHRQELVHKIFKRYRERTPNIFDEQLNEELFLQRLNQAAKGSIVQISYNALFLTVLCYTYISHIRDGLNPEKVWERGTHDLVLECVKLLISDIDKSKTRGLPINEREALMNRRASWAEEKLQLLQFLAAECYVNGITLMDQEWITQKSEHFFTHLSNSSRASEICNGLELSDPTSNIITQLVFSGLLQLSEALTLKTYDFPHRRFREVLAVDYFSSTDGCKTLLKQSISPDIATFLPFYAASTNRWEEVGELLGGEMISGKTQIEAVFINLIEDMPAAKKAAVLRKIITEASRQDTVLLPEELLKFFPISDSEYYQRKLIEAGLGSSEISFSLYLGIVRYQSPENAKEICVTILKRNEYSSPVYWAALIYIVRLNDASLIGDAVYRFISTNDKLQLATPDTLRFAKIVSSVPRENAYKVAINGAFERVPQVVTSELALLFSELLQQSSTDGPASKMTMEFLKAPVGQAASVWRQGASGSS